MSTITHLMKAAGYCYCCKLMTNSVWHPWEKLPIPNLKEKTKIYVTSDWRKQITIKAIENRLHSREEEYSRRCHRENDAYMPTGSAHNYLTADNTHRKKKSNFWLTVWLDFQIHQSTSWSQLWNSRRKKLKCEHVQMLAWFEYFVFSF